MTIEECYTKLESDYREIVRRLGKEERVKKFLSLFPEDESYPALCAALEEGRGEEAFRAAHSLKGICMNLGIERLYRMADVLTAVSYTHLDVYKRQPLKHPARFPLPCGPAQGLPLL